MLLRATEIRYIPVIIAERSEDFFRSGLWKGSIQTDSFNRGDQDNTTNKLLAVEIAAMRPLLASRDYLRLL